MRGETALAGRLRNETLEKVCDLEATEEMIDEGQRSETLGSDADRVGTKGGEERVP